MTNAFAALAFAALALMACSFRPNPPLTANQPVASAGYEEQVEEGFGRLDQLPVN